MVVQYRYHKSTNRQTVARETAPTFHHHHQLAVHSLRRNCPGGGLLAPHPLERRTVDFRPRETLDGPSFPECPNHRRSVYVVRSELGALAASRLAGFPRSYRSVALALPFHHAPLVMFSGFVLSLSASGLGLF